MMRLNRKDMTKRVIAFSIVAFLGLLAFIPLYWMVITAIKPPALTLRFPPELFPTNPTI